MTSTALMKALRRRLASGALALTVLQFTLLFAAPVSACCPGAGRDHAALAATNEVECCPPGTHPPGECPLHKASKSRNAAPCRMTCDAPHGPQFLLGAVGVVPAPQSTEIEFTAYAVLAAAPLAVTARPSVPDTPPPRL
jgi:hypothetical protein